MTDAEPQVTAPTAVPDLPALAEFTAVARWQHLTRAAEELGVAQSTLSRRLQRLERSVGVDLLQRRGRRVELTRAGARLAAVAESALGELGRALADIHRSVDPEQGTVALSFLNSMGVAVVPGMLREYRTQHPRVRFQLTQEGHDAALARVRSGDVDMALTSPLPVEPGLSAVALHEQPLCLVVPEGHHLAASRSTRLAAVAAEAFVGFKPGFGMRLTTEESCRRAGFSPRLAFEGEDVATVRGMVAAGLGVGLLPTSARPAGGTRELALEDQSITRTIGLVTRRGHDLTPSARGFHDFLLREGAVLVAAGMARPE